MARPAISKFYPRTNRLDQRLYHQLCPYSRESLDVLQAARQAGAKILAITDSPVSFSAGGRLHAAVLHRQSVIFPFRGLRHGLAECLLAMLVVRHGEAVSKIENAERYLIESGMPT